MPVREQPLVTGRTYHVFNRMMTGERPLSEERIKKRVLMTLWYYQSVFTPYKFSNYLDLTQDIREEYKRIRHTKSKRVVLLAYCLMPNHYHLLLRQEVENGIADFVGWIQNSLVRYWNTRHKRRGTLFEGRFKAKAIHADEVLLHVSRYIHLNPITSGLIKDLRSMGDFLGSSWGEYMGTPQFIQLTDIHEILEMVGSRDSYREFCENQVDYQQTLHWLKEELGELDL